VLSPNPNPLPQPHIVGTGTFSMASAPRLVSADVVPEEDLLGPWGCPQGLFLCQDGLLLA